MAWVCLSSLDGVDSPLDNRVGEIGAEKGGETAVCELVEGTSVDRKGIVELMLALAMCLLSSAGST